MQSSQQNANDKFEEILEPETKRIRIKDQNGLVMDSLDQVEKLKDAGRFNNGALFTLDNAHHQQGTHSESLASMSVSGASASIINQSLLTNMDMNPLSEENCASVLSSLDSVPDGSNPIESLKMALEHYRKENEKKDVTIQDLLRKMHEAQLTIKMQADQIKELQDRLSVNHNVDGLQDTKPLALVPRPLSQQPLLELQILTQPPGQAVYQRILRPNPTVAVIGVTNLKSCSNLFVEVSLLKQDEQNPRAQYQSVQSCKGGSSPLAGERKNLIGGQLVQRSEAGSNPDTLVVVFRKLKVLTTTAQQGGAFFVLKFVLKRYVDNSFEPVPNVNCVLSDPIEVFSHTLYLKGRNPGSRSLRSSEEKLVFPLPSIMPKVDGSPESPASPESPHASPDLASTPLAPKTAEVASIETQMTNLINQFQTSGQNQAVVSSQSQPSNSNINSTIATLNLKLPAHLVTSISNSNGKSTKRSLPQNMESPDYHEDNQDESSDVVHLLALKNNLAVQNKVTIN